MPVFTEARIVKNNWVYTNKSNDKEVNEVFSKEIRDLEDFNVSCFKIDRYYDRFFQNTVIAIYHTFFIYLVFYGCFNHFVFLNNTFLLGLLRGYIFLLIEFFIQGLHKVYPIIGLILKKKK